MWNINVNEKIKWKINEMFFGFNLKKKLKKGDE